MADRTDTVERDVDAAALDIMGAATDLDAARLELEARADLPGLVRALVACREMLLNLGSIHDSCEAAIAELMQKHGEGVRRVTLPGVGTVVRSARYNDTYDSSALFRLLVDRALREPSSGMAADIELRNQVLAVMSAALPISNSLRWRQAGLKALGVDIEEYRHRDYGRDRIEID